MTCQNCNCGTPYYANEGGCATAANTYAYNDSCGCTQQYGCQQCGCQQCGGNCRRNRGNQFASTLLLILLFGGF